MGPPVVFDWFWKPLAELPRPDPSVSKDLLGRDSYVKYLDGESARLALDEIERMLTPSKGREGPPS